MSRLALDRIRWTPALLGLIAAGCTEAADCKLEPHRCVQPAAEVQEPATPQTGRHARADAPRPFLGPQRLRPVPAGEQPGGGQKYLDLPAGDAQRLGSPGRPPRPQAGPTDVVVPEHALVRKAIDRIAPAAKAHDLAQLKAFMTPRFAEQITPVVQQHGERFWRHLDNYARAIEAGYQIEVLPADRPGSIQAVLKSGEQRELKPILTRDGNDWKFDRF